MASTTTKLGARQLERTGAFETLVELERRLRAVETELELMDEQQEAHILAKKKDARDQIERADVETVVIVSPPEDNDGTDAIGKINGIVTFVDPGEFELEKGDAVRVRIYDVGKNHAESLALRLLEDGQ